MKHKGYCWNCGYSMIGWPTTICPECGHGPEYYFQRITTGRVLRGKVAKVLLPYVSPGPWETGRRPWQITRQGPIIVDSIQLSYRPKGLCTQPIDTR